MCGDEEGDSNKKQPERPLYHRSDLLTVKKAGRIILLPKPKVGRLNFIKSRSWV
jgi:hypothetical protein